MLQKSVIWMAVWTVTLGLPSVQQKLVQDGRIIGGEIVAIEQYPFQVSIQYLDSHNCGGSIIAKDIVLTAGHCISRNLTVRAGSNFTTKGGSWHQVVKSIRHENFSSNWEPINDIALLKVVPPFHIDDSRRPIDLHNNEKNIKDGALGTVSGFGVTDSGWISRELRAVTVPVVNREKCSKKYLDLGFGKVTNDFICGGFPEGGKDSCQGDSGGPFVVNGKIAGIVSYGYKCAQPEIPGVYTNVAYFCKWIEQNTKLLKDLTV